MGCAACVERRSGGTRSFGWANASRCGHQLLGATWPRCGGAAASAVGRCDHGAIVAMEMLSFLSRPVSHSVRLFANMLAGHITLQVFAGFVIMLGSAGILGVFGATLPFIMVVLLYALELLVAFLQAYVFAILTCIYLNDAFHPGH